MWPSHRLIALHLVILWVVFLGAILCARSPSGPSTPTTNKIIGGPVEEVNDVKDLKKILRTKNNVLVLFISTTKRAYSLIKLFREVAEEVRGQGTMVLIDCYPEAGRKTCKKLKANPEPFLLRHYKDGEYHRDYDRQLSVTSMAAFMRDPTGDAPWEEDPTATDVIHIPDIQALQKLVRKEASRPLLIMFYAPWCGFCKTLKPEYARAASEVRGQAVMAAIDVNRPENSPVRQLYNISGFPTLIYFSGGEQQFVYEGDNKREALVSFMRDPKAAAARPAPEPEQNWADMPGTQVLHLTQDSFPKMLKEHSSLLVMFYAPWCGHCKKMKPEYEKAAETLLQKQISGKLAAVDATKEGALGSQFGVKGYPTLKYFKDGELAFDVNLREADPLVSFMQDPKEPPPPPPPEAPWSEQPSEVVHLNDESFKPFLKKKKHVLVMFYAPWCGHCKKAKPEFSAAAERFKDDPKVWFGAVDCTIQQALCKAYEVKGYPTFKYYSYLNKDQQPYNGGRTEADFIAFMQDPSQGSTPQKPPTPATDPREEFRGMEGSEHIVYLTTANFEAELGLRGAGDTLVLFYAPWCGHCKAMKADYARAAGEARKGKSETDGPWLAAVDVTQNEPLQRKYEISGFPTLKVFRKGEFLKDYQGGRKSADFLKFLDEQKQGKPKKDKKDKKEEL